VSDDLRSRSDDLAARPPLPALRQPALGRCAAIRASWLSSAHAPSDCWSSRISRLCLIVISLDRRPSAFNLT